jgi:hypothetical protein
VQLIKNYVLQTSVKDNKMNNRQFHFTIVFLSFFLILNSCTSVLKPVYVSVDGNDNNKGTKNSPFATIERAQEKVRELKESNQHGNITVCIRGGEYHIKNTVVLSCDDSGNNGQTITYAAYPGEIPVFTSTVPIKKWKFLNEFPEDLPEVAKGKVWVADISFIRAIKKRQTASSSVAPQTQRNQLFYTLYCQNKILPRAKGKTFSFRTTELINRSEHKTFMFPEETIKNWSDLYNAELNIIPLRKWVSNILPIADIDEETGVGHTVVPGTYTLIKHYDNPKNGVGHVENVMAVLDEPGEWVIDSKNNKLYLWPENGKPGNNISAPVLTELFRVEGEIDYEGSKDRPVKNIAFREITFTGADRFIFEGETGWGVQHDWEKFDSPSAMLRFRGTNNCIVQDCHFTTAGSSGLRIDLHGISNQIVGCNFEHLGGVGILLAGYGPGTKNVNLNNRVRNNYIHHIGEQYHGSPAIFVWQSQNNCVLNNLISHVPYTGICVTGRVVWDTLGVSECSKTIRWNEVGGKKSIGKYAFKDTTWHTREPFLHSRNNLISRNDINNVMEICGDGNCIYISGAGKGNRIIENYCHNAPSYRTNSAIRCDDDQNETTIERNIIYRIGGNAEGLMIKGKNKIIQNILVDLKTVDNHRGMLRFYKGVVDSSVIKQNIFYSTNSNQKAFCKGIKDRNGYVPDLHKTKADYNIYYSTVNKNWGKKHLAHYKHLGVEKHSIVANPMFVDVNKQNFQFKSNSPALKMGIKQPIKIKQTGPQGIYRNQFYNN